MSVKQVIVMRTKFPDGKGGFFSPRKGKLIAQGAHASMMWLSERIRKFLYCPLHMSADEMEWINGTFTKITLQVETEEELVDVYNKAKEKGLTAHLVIDSGKTEFDGPTATAVAIGPHKSEEIDPITSSLKLY